MQSFEELLEHFSLRFQQPHFPEHPASLYTPNNYFLSLGGKRIRPILCLMGNELFDDISPDAWELANAIELFHNFTLIHDDIMDQAPMRRGMQTVHEKFGSSTALLAGDVMLVAAYDYINRIDRKYIHPILHLFNKTAREVCEGQQLDMDFEKMEQVSLPDYLQMIELKTSVLLAAALRMGAVLGGAGEGNQQHLYEFGRNLGIAFQIQDDYLDAFGDPEKVGKQVGGDILANKKTFLLIKAQETMPAAEKQELSDLLAGQEADKVNRVLRLFRNAGVDTWAYELKNQYMKTALFHLDEMAVLSVRKKPLQELASYLMEREY